MAHTLTVDVADLDTFVRAFEEAHQAKMRPTLDAFLPPREHPLHVEVLEELVRIDLEAGWSNGKPRALQAYLDDFPELLGDSERLGNVAFEEYRLRLLHGQRPTPCEYEERFGVLTSSWPLALNEEEQVAGDEGDEQPPTLRLSASNQTGSNPLEAAAVAYAAFRLQDSHGPGGNIDHWCESFSGSRVCAELFRELHDSDPKAACRAAQAAAAMPEVGTRFLDFFLLEELGRGTFGRVFLARQGDLHDRLVALKISADLGRESRSLAQLQHTHIMPLYSTHRAGAFQAVCMPYLGSTTLADVLKELAGFETLPQSGTDLLSTLRAKQSAAKKSSVFAVSGRDTKRPNHTLPVSAGQSPIVKSVPHGPGEPSSAVIGMLRDMSYVGAVIWIAMRVTEALEHAHERGILHRDIKPANVLLTDQGPMLLDFNLAEDTKVQQSMSAAMLGGTLPYMAPEHLEAFRGGKRPVDARSDLYSLGVILYELLTGRAPYGSHRGTLKDVLPQMLMDRHGPVPSVRRYNKAVPPAVESIIRQLLQPDINLRYQSASQLLEDLSRNDRHLPLEHAPNPSWPERARKFFKRNRAVLAATACAVAITGLAMFGIDRERKKTELQRAQPRLLAIEQLENTNRNLYRTGVELQLRDYQRPAALSAGIDRASKLLAAYGVLENANWQLEPLVAALPEADQKTLNRQIGLLLTQMTQAGLAIRNEARYSPALLSLWHERAKACFPEIPWMLKRQEARLAALQGGVPGPVQQNADQPTTSDDYQVLAEELVSKGQFTKALPYLKQAVQLDPRNFWAWWQKAVCHQELAQLQPAVECLNVCVALHPHQAATLTNRGIAFQKAGDYASAQADARSALACDPTYGPAYELRATNFLAWKKSAEAIQDFTKAIELLPDRPRLYLMRAAARAAGGDVTGADVDRQEGLKLVPKDERDWIALSRSRTADKQASVKMLEQALLDLDQALTVNPRCRLALHNKASILAERLNRNEEAVVALNRALELYPDAMDDRAGRAVVLARLGRRDAALQDVAYCLKNSPSPQAVYQAACVYALTSRTHPADKPEALRLLAESFRRDYGIQLALEDRDMEPLWQDADFKRIHGSAKALASR